MTTPPQWQKMKTPRIIDRLREVLEKVRNEAETILIQDREKLQKLKKTRTRGGVDGSS